jgi:hypothetical protein
MNTYEKDSFVTISTKKSSRVKPVLTLIFVATLFPFLVFIGWSLGYHMAKTKYKTTITIPDSTNFKVSPKEKR